IKGMGAVGIGLVAATLLGGCETLLEPGDGAAAARNFPDVRRLATCERLSSLGKGGTRCSSSLRTTKASNYKRSNSRSEERRVGQECLSQCKYRGWMRP